jgi:hypothetical protein
MIRANQIKAIEAAPNADCARISQRAQPALQGAAAA